MTSLSSEVDLDAREILRYLNELGIRNISGEALRDFIIDLKKLIRCDLKQNSDDGYEIQGPERLHSASTFSSRLRSRRLEPSSGYARKCPRERNIKNHVSKTDNIVRNVASAPTLRDNNKLPQRRSSSCTNVEVAETKSEPVKRRPTTSSSSIIKVPVTHHQKKADPVSLYHYYLSLWDKYKMNLPGENPWAELRWSIRQKLAGDIKQPILKKTAAPTSKELEKRRQGWVD